MMPCPIRFTVSLPLLLILCPGSPAARAAETPAFIKPAVINLGHDIVYPVARTARVCSGRMKTIAQPIRQTVFVNFDGAPLKSGSSHAPTNKTELIASDSLDYPAMSWERFGGRDTGLKEVMDEVRLLFLDFALTFVTERPTSGDYTMVMVGGSSASSSTSGGDTAGVAPLDCDNGNLNDICFVFGDMPEINTPRSLAQVIAHELGHTFGLEHVQDPKGIMHPVATGTTCCWVDSELSEPSSCMRSRQDDRQILSDNVGVGEGDTISPRIWFVRPGVQAVMPPDLTFEVTAADDLRVHHVEVFIDGNSVINLQSPPYTGLLSDLSDGDHTLRAVAHDFKPNTAEAEVTFTVDSRCIDRGTCFEGQGGVTKTCEHGSDCMSGLCARREGDGQCVAACTEGETAVCPTGSTCTEVDAEWACLPGDGWSLDQSGDGGGCALSSGTLADATAPGVMPFSMLGLVVALVLVAMYWRRRWSRETSLRKDGGEK